MIIGNVMYMTDKGEDKLVKMMPEDLSELTTECVYLLNDLIYEYIGTVNHTGNIPEGCIGRLPNGRVLINWIEDEELKLERASSSLSLTESEDTSSIVLNYLHNYNSGNNLLKHGNRRITDNSDIYMPVIDEEVDNDLTKLIKLQARHKKISRSEYKASGKLKEGYSFDNMISALDGNTTINRFIDWCNLLELDWKICLMDNGKNELFCDKPLIVTNNQDISFEYEPPKRGIYLVPIESWDDPLKKLVKTAVFTRVMVPAKYKKKGSTSHLVNNMMSSLKRKGRMMFDYFRYWCEILDFDYYIEVTDPTDGYIVRFGSFESEKNTVISDQTKTTNVIMEEDAIDDDL